MKKKDNQNFVNIPFGQLREKLNYLCERHNIELVEQEESYTSKADFFSNDFIPTYGVKGNHFTPLVVTVLNEACISPKQDVKLMLILTVLLIL